MVKGSARKASLAKSLTKILELEASINIAEEVALPVTTENIADREGTPDNRFMEEIMQIPQKLMDDSIRKEPLLDVKSQLTKFKEKMQTNFKHFTTFKGFVNRKL